MWRPTVSSDELYHHGILGMRWGKKNGPPYPLGAEDHSSSEKKAGWRKSLSDEQKATIKKAAKITANVAVTALLAYGSYKLIRDPKARALVGKGMQLVHDMDTKKSLEEAIKNSGPEIIGKNGKKIDEDTFERIINQKARSSINLEFGRPSSKEINTDMEKLLANSKKLSNMASQSYTAATKSTGASDYTKELLKKNKSKLSGMTMKDLKDLNLY